mmetsp:Transcript_42525/g.65349  ORF Transcript_42525/g.65349 Transcript_42525/m.65349 type:complete len:207 (+) Transcript_42525:117-737(+)|eukprot:CAMPEP_0117003644 /NCGR_PEP_ID=MMETSP0472-20121206/4898_1 /TAXON_ID=693140 ORGANISM="Tiarina fusus, Strain LIS" /NCGR_SAMPLE_ID=MMETSP0472 /ASSEMBLY_ACC=CAM_ASM_000603 /LENGTH=206 /DNA_ID=CAMNT_0004704367 /DNA_START=186 /DNA_END=806 /DNA_ORIENTATION=+
MSEEEKKPEAEEEEEDEEDLEKLQAEIARMEAEAARITKETEELEKKKEAKLASTGGSSGDAAKGGESTQKDGHSIYVGQVDYSATPEELLSHFEACGTVERVTIVCDKMSGRPKGFAYLEFQTEEAADNAVKLDGSEFKGRTLKVTHKRVNIAGFNHQQPFEGGGRGGRGGRGFRGGRGYRGGYRGGRGGYRGGGRGRGGYHPYY